MNHPSTPNPQSDVLSKPELRVLQVFSKLSMGGAETWLMALLRYLHSKHEEIPFRVRFDVLLTAGEKHVFDDEAQSLGARLLYVPYSQKRLLSFRREFRRILARGQYHAIHDHQGYPAGLHFLMGLGRLPRVRMAHFHNAIPSTSKSRITREQLVTIAEKQFVSLLATHITATSSQLLSEHNFKIPFFKSVNRTVVHCGFNVSRFCADAASHKVICREFGWEPTAKILLFAGRLGPDVLTLHDSEGTVQSEKNPLFAIEVAAEVMARDSSVRFLMAGGGDGARVQFEQQVSIRGLSDKIRFLGVRTDLPNLMAGSDLFLFPSIAEGLGMVAVEAQAAGLRVLASDTIPSDCLVVPGMVTFCSLQASATYWAEEALRLLHLPFLNKFECNQAVQNSAFSVENSARHLLRLYSGQ